MAKSRLRLVTPATVNRTLTPKRPPNSDLRTREYLTEAEVERLLKAVKANRWARRDGTMILVAYRHGLRASELTDLRLLSTGSPPVPNTTNVCPGQGMEFDLMQLHLDRPASQRIDQEELQAVTHATLRAHATSDEAKAFVAKLAAMVEVHVVSTGSRKNRRKSTAGKLEYATGAFVANLLRPLGAEEPNDWVWRSMHAKSFTGAAVSHRTFTQLVDGLTELALIERVGCDACSRIFA